MPEVKLKLACKSAYQITKPLKCNRIECKHLSVNIKFFKIKDTNLGYIKYAEKIFHSIYEPRNTTEVGSSRHAKTDGSSLFPLSCAIRHRICTQCKCKLVQLY